MRIGILETGRPPAELRDRHGSYAEMLSRLIGAADARFSFTVFSVLDDVFPDAPEFCDGWLITGSKHGVYEDLPWMRRLKTFLRDAVAAKVPVVGICFGHQILAEALGGRVEKAAQGWGVGPHTYRLAAKPAWMDGAPDTFCINAMHQDQVVVLPEGAAVIARSEFCPYAVLAYGNTAISFQAHPEFDAAFERDLLELRQSGVVPDDRAEPALAALEAPGAVKDAALVGCWIAHFFRQAKKSRAEAAR
ncbi:MAG TPA: gamma-glutamyl-gamma-aminobutyrate hydrolase family protein [Azospirillaceae bacterium]|nr:gamma-glutamyl-gamma-aminobutyrate hydrolase family protein [Azospirillaceae bacterium]